jgi:hypothetical protein
MECAKCKKPATLACGGCRGSPILEGDAPIVHYCDTTCQKADWAQHKPTCQRLKDRTTLYRVADIARRLFLLHRELTWSQFDIQRVEKSGVNLFLRGEVRTCSETIPKLNSYSPGTTYNWMLMLTLPLFTDYGIRVLASRLQGIPISHVHDTRRQRCCVDLEGMH